MSPPTKRVKSNIRAKASEPAIIGSHSIEHARKQYFFNVMRVPIAKLQLNPENPRFAAEGEIRGKKLTAAEMEDRIWDDPRTYDLYNSVLENGGLLERIWVWDDFVVIEGNRRSAVLRTLMEECNSGKLEKYSKGAFDYVDAVVVPSRTNQEVIRSLLGVWHIAQKKSWSAVAEAKFIHESFVNDRGLKEISRALGRSIPYLSQKKWAYEQMKAFLAAHPREANENHFSYFEELFKQRNALSNPDLVVRLIDRQGEGKGARYQALTEITLLYDWILEKRFEREGARGVRWLPRILENQSNYKRFMKNGFEAVRNEIELSDPTRADRRFAALDIAITALRSLNAEGASFSKGTPKHQILVTLRAELDKLTEL